MVSPLSIVPSHRRSNPDFSITPAVSICRRRWDDSAFCAPPSSDEAFSAKGRPARICRRCRRLPRKQQEALLHENEIRGFLEQSHISKKNVARLCMLTESRKKRISKLANVMLEVARSARYRRHRIRNLAREHRGILTLMEEVGPILPRLARVDTDQFDDNPLTAWDEWVEFASDCAEVSERSGLVASHGGYHLRLSGRHPASLRTAMFCLHLPIAFSNTQRLQTDVLDCS